MVMIPLSGTGVQAEPGRFGIKTWGRDIVAGGTSADFDAPIIDGHRIDRLLTWGPSRQSAGQADRLLSGAHAVQVRLVHVLAPIGMEPEAFPMGIGGLHEDDWPFLRRLETMPRSRFWAKWPITDRWSLAGDAGQRTAFWLSRWLPHFDVSFELYLSQMRASHRGDNGIVTTLSVITSGAPTSSEVLIADTSTGLADPASYALTSGDLEALGPGDLLFEYHPIRTGKFGALSRPVSAPNALTTVGTFQELLPRRPWSASTP